jgi:hypothetical protein
MNDVRKMIYGTIIGFFMVLGLWFSIIYVSSCGFTFSCHRGDPLVQRTPVPTLIPVSHSESNMIDMGSADFDKCYVAAFDLIGAWVSAGIPETEAFSFADVNGQACEGSYAEDIHPLLLENSVWQPGSLGCVSCHNADLADRSAGLDLSSYDAISGSNVLGTSWENSSLHQVLSMGLSPDGHSADLSAGNPLVFAGTQTVSEEEEAP